VAYVLLNSLISMRALTGGVLVVHGGLFVGVACALL
jgi:hypothetical protein